MLTAAYVGPLALLEMRNRRGLYYWPRPIQFLICLADGIPLRRIGKYRNQEEAMQAFLRELHDGR